MKRLEAIRRSEHLKSLKEHIGWKEVEKILVEIMEEALITLIEKEDVEARARLKVIKQILETMDVVIDIGETIRRKYER